MMEPVKIECVCGLAYTTRIECYWTEAEDHALIRVETDETGCPTCGRTFRRERPAFDRESPYEAHLILVSDLMQNRGAVNFHEAFPSFRDFARTRSYRALRTRHLRGARVTVLRLPESGDGVNTRSLSRFWKDYFESQGVERICTGFVELEGSGDSRSSNRKPSESGAAETR